MKHHLDHIRALEAATGESILVGFLTGLGFCLIGWTACIMGAWG